MKIQLFLISLVMTIGALQAEPLVQIDSPLKAAVFYFPSPATARCLNHSGIPKKLRKAKISRIIKFPDKNELTQDIKVAISDKNKNPYFATSKEVKSGFLFGLEDLIGLQRKVHVKDKIGTQKLDYETFLKVTKGKIGDKKYYLELHGEDKVQDGKIRYFLKGHGMLSEYEIEVESKNTEKDHYEVNERYGPIEVFTRIEVYD